MTDKQKQSIKNMRQLGFTYSAIADSSGLSQNTVKSFCRRENIYVVYTMTDNMCKCCGNPLEHSSGKKKKTFCSDKCRSDWWNQNRQWVNRNNKYSITCLSCGKEFDSYGGKERKYCSRKCYTRSRYGEGLP